MWRETETAASCEIARGVKTRKRWEEEKLGARIWKQSYSGRTARQARPFRAARDTTNIQIDAMALAIDLVQTITVGLGRKMGLCCSSYREPIDASGRIGSQSKDREQNSEGQRSEFRHMVIEIK